MEIVKAEILFSRKCNLNCSYCSMADGRSNTLGIKDWCRGFNNLKQLGCSFAAFYGAEPLLEIEKLVLVINYAESIGIKTTVITSGQVPHFKEYLQDLIDFGGLKSLTMSFDLNPHDKSSSIKSLGTIAHLEWFREHCPDCRDIAAITTLHRRNYKHLLHSIDFLSKKGIWSFFDLYHFDRGNIGTKVKGLDPTLLFKEEDYPKLIEILRVVESRKETHLVHNSSSFLQKLEENDYHLLKYLNWNCSSESSFPAWVTVDCDGMVYPCDDFIMKNATLQLSINDLYENWEEWKEYWRYKVLKKCNGCAWNTHFDALQIKKGLLNIGSYIHGN